MQVLNKSVPSYDPCNFTNANFTTAVGSLANFIQSVNWMDDSTYNDAVNATVNDGWTPPPTRGGGLPPAFRHRFYRQPDSALCGGPDSTYRSAQLNALHSPAQTPTFPLQPGSDYATPPNSNPSSREKTRFSLATGTITWGANDGVDKFIDITINNDPAVQFNEDILYKFGTR